jgi:AcrR family transcriptional regulator
MLMPSKKKKAANPAVRDPSRTRRCILAAALHEFAVRGYAGARVNAIARRAKANKRMLYHYFADKEGLFRAVIRHKICDRVKRVEAQAAEPGLVSDVPLWFKQNCLDADWVRLLAWESLQTVNDKVLDEADRRKVTRRAIALVKQKQKAGKLRSDVPAEYLQLAKVSLSMFPLALPQAVRLIIGRSPHDAKFQRDYARFLETISKAFRP